MFYGDVVRYGRMGCLSRPMPRHPFPLRTSHMMVQYRIEFIKGMGRGVKRVVEAEKETLEKQSRDVEANHGTWRERGGKAMREEKKGSRKRAREEQETKRAREQRGGNQALLQWVRPTWLLPGNYGVEFRQNANILHHLTENGS